MSNLFLRHGEVNNLKNIQYADIPGYSLNEKGKSQAHGAAKKIQNQFEIKKIISSPLLRARQTAEIVSNLLKVKVIYSKNLSEWCGSMNWIGKTIDEIVKTKEYKIYKNNPQNILKPVEPLVNVYERVLNEYINNQNTLFVSHQDTIRSFTYFFTVDDDFTKFRPKHCEIQSINNSKIVSY